MRTRSPLTIVVEERSTNPDRVKRPILVHRYEAVIYRRSELDRKSPASGLYYEPNGEYYIRLGHFRLPVVFRKNGFLLKMTPHNFMRVFYPQQEEKASHHG